MKIENVELKNFMVFDDTKISFSPNINIISGENATGKTALMKLVYSALKGYETASDVRTGLTKENLESSIVEKLQGVFRPDKNSIGRLVRRVRGSNRLDVAIVSDNSVKIRFGFSNRSSNHMDLVYREEKNGNRFQAIYIPPKEIISATENFGSLYSDYHIAFEETYYDLARLLEKPLKKGPNTNEQTQILKSIGKIINGTVVQKDNKFYLKVSGSGEYEMGLVSEGYRKLSTITYLILTGSLTKNTVLFWDEPETNMNPKMIKYLAEMLKSLARMGVQIFITTHSYFVQQEFNLDSVYRTTGKKEKELKYSFISLSKTDEGTVRAESAEKLSELKNNAIMEEFDDLYKREQELIYAE